MTADSWKFFLLMAFLCLVAQAFFTMAEMAAVSFNKVRLEYYVGRGDKRGIWLSRLIKQPTLLFGTSMLGVNTAMLLGSECARRFYLSIGLSPDWAALTQTVLVVIFAEIAPMFAGRKYAEHAAMLSIPILYAVSVVLKPIVFFFTLLCDFLNKIFGMTKEKGFYLSREELQKILEEREEVPEVVHKGVPANAPPEEFDTIVKNIFILKNKIAQELMLPLNRFLSIPASSSVGDVRHLLVAEKVPFLTIYNRNPQNIVAIVYPRDLLRDTDDKRVSDRARPPWFIVQTNSILDILKQFRRNNQVAAVVLNQTGLAVGILTLDAIIDEIFGRDDTWISITEPHPEHNVIVDRTFPSDTTLEDLNKQYYVQLAYGTATNLEELFEEVLGHKPAKGDAIRIDQFELTVEEAPLIGPKMISIHTLS